MQNERETYEVVVEDGLLVYKQRGELVNTTEGSKWIFVLSTSKCLYVGQKKKGVFQHSSFLSGAVTSAAGRLVATNGILQVRNTLHHRPMRAQLIAQMRAFTFSCIFTFPIDAALSQ